jgi:hypothetical protein
MIRLALELDDDVAEPGCDFSCTTDHSVIDVASSIPPAPRSRWAFVVRLATGGDAADAGNAGGAAQSATPGPPATSAVIRCATRCVWS